MLADSWQHHITDSTGILVLFVVFFVTFQRQVGTKVCYFTLYQFHVSRQPLGSISFYNVAFLDWSNYSSF